MERVTGIEPAWPAWKAGTLPLSYTRRPGPKPQKRTTTLVVRRRGDWTRTSGLLLPKQVRYQLRYTPLLPAERHVAPDSSTALHPDALRRCHSRPGSGTARHLRSCAIQARRWALRRVRFVSPANPR